mgnify:CR=1 FL=1
MVYLQRQGGNATEVAAGAAAATGEDVVVQSAVREYDHADYPLLIQPLLDGEADAVFARDGHASKTARRASKAMGLPDSGGSAKAFRRDVLRELGLEPISASFSAQVAAKLAAGDYRLAHAALAQRPDGNT